MSEVIYFNGLRGKQGNYGIKLSGKADEIIEEIRKHQNSKGYINLEVKQRKEADKYGNTHYVVVDTFEPKARTESAPEPAQPKEQATDDLPF
jgi:nicotinate-nucleotide pyrophosphorylase